MLRVEVVWCPAPGRIDLTPLELPEGSTLADAVHASGVLVRHGLALDALDTGIWFRACAPDTPLRDQDQVQLYRPLTVDPKEARRLRYRKKGRATDSPTK